MFSTRAADHRSAVTLAWRSILRHRKATTTRKRDEFRGGELFAHKHSGVLRCHWIGQPHGARCPQLDVFAGLLVIGGLVWAHATKAAPGGAQPRLGYLRYGRYGRTIRRDNLQRHATRCIDVSRRAAANISPSKIDIRKSGGATFSAYQ